MSDTTASKVTKISASQVLDKFQMVMMNNIHTIDPDFSYTMGPGAASDSDEEELEIYQTFIVETEEDGAQWLANFYPVGYSELLENYAVAITHYGTPWMSIQHELPGSDIRTRQYVESQADKD